jgi:hypothetical protein
VKASLRTAHACAPPQSRPFSARFNARARVQKNRQVGLSCFALLRPSRRTGPEIAPPPPQFSTPSRSFHVVCQKDWALFFSFQNDF